MKAPVSSPDRLLTARQVADRLQVSVAWVLAHAGGRKLPALLSLKLGKSVRFREDEIERTSGSNWRSD